MQNNAFDSFALNDNKYQFDLDKYRFDGPPGRGAEEFHIKDIPGVGSVPFPAPQISLFAFLGRMDVEALMSLSRNGEIRAFIENHIPRPPKGLPRMVIVQLMYTVSKFCKKFRYSLEQTAVVLSQFYLAHLFFINAIETGPGKLYNYFREMQLKHSLPFPPHSLQVFNLQETKDILTFFCRIYLRNLPIIRLLVLPNFSIRVNYPLEPKMKSKKKSKRKTKKKGKKRENKLETFTNKLFL